MRTSVRVFLLCGCLASGAAGAGLGCRDRERTDVSPLAPQTREARAAQRYAELARDQTRRSLEARLERLSSRLASRGSSQALEQTRARAEARVSALQEAPADAWGTQAKAADRALQALEDELLRSGAHARL